MRRVVIAVAVTALLSGCGPATHLNLDLRTVSITVPRLVTPALVLVPPSATPVPPSLPPLPPLVTLLPPPPVSTGEPVVSPPAPACPKASPFAVPAVPGTPLVQGPPAPDHYVQTTAGALSTVNGRSPIAGQLDVVVTKLPGSATATGQLVDSWAVQRTDASRGVSVEYYQLVHASSPVSATAPGIYLVGLAWKDARGSLTFQPVGGGLEILPNPVQQSTSTGVQYVGTATDPNTLTTLTLVRNVTERKRIDLCGQLVDTYTVAMTGTLTNRDIQRQVTWTQQLATAYGGADVEDTLTLTSPSPTDAFTWTRTAVSTHLPKEIS